MKTVKILFLDDAPWFLPDSPHGGVELRVVMAGQWGTGDVYAAPASVCESIQKLTSEKAVDIVVIGNNMGAGVPKARAIADDMRDVTIVVWNQYSLGIEGPYTALGLTRFGSRTDLREMIPALLREKGLL